MCLVKVYNSTCARNLCLSSTKIGSTTIYKENSVLLNSKDDRYPKDSFMLKFGRSIYKVFAKKNFWANDSQGWTSSS